ncbi:hypothetical protein PCASD_19413 [Puccinia coronata f. sp. avenae]|uniref:Peroxisomal membrane protein PEX14-like KPWE domain-containing protein n=1 Tax=Puccinia coronata f. sp. avenae TaxID=200324 RepID=A0A2N5SGA8_9BASI|nr:hypothetical protein PCASD_24503 [Puccinia coronata f. sp. avenae]PLW12281.1 hypothetical protein PCASD_19413 [Puccinia coronata f. sp. avenae]
MESGFQDGLNIIISNYQSQLGRPLTKEEHAAIQQQAIHFFQTHQNQTTAPPSTTTVALQSHQLTQHIQQAQNNTSLEHPSHPESTSSSNNSTTHPTYPTDFYTLAKLIADSSSSTSNNNPHDLLDALIKQNHLLHLEGLKKIPDTLNPQEPTQPILAKQSGAGKKPWEAS